MLENRISIKNIISVFLFGSFVRYFLITNSVVSQRILNCVEVSTPFNSWKKAIEGVHLKKLSISPYNGDTFHETPIMLQLYENILEMEPHTISFIFVMCDLLTAAVLYLGARQFFIHLNQKEGASSLTYQKSIKSLLFKYQDSTHLCLYVAAIYLMNPYSILSCAGKSTTVFHNLILATILYLALKRHLLATSILLGFASYLSLYSSMLTIPALLILSATQNKNDNSCLSWKIVFLLGGTTFLATSALLVGISYKMTGDSFEFIQSVYGAMLNVQDLTPNIGLFWYFFTEMFEHFRTFFIWTFQLNAFIYTIPLAIRLRKEPVLLFWSLLALIAIFKSYPSVGDVGFYLALLPLWWPLLSFMKQSFLVGCIFSSCTLLAPILWHLWILTGSANANFYFGITLAFNTGQIFLLTDVLFAYIRREYYLQNGLKVDSSCKPVQLELK